MPGGFWKWAVLPVLTVLFGAGGAWAQSEPRVSPWVESNPDWVQPVAPFRVIGNVYFVGTEGFGIFLIATPDGLVLLDGGIEGYASQIADSVAALGFDITDVRYLLNSHAHFDHSGGLAELKARSGATLVATEGDRSALEGGFYLGFEEDASLGAPPVAVDQIIGDGETLTLGDVVLTAHLTPGHTRGCTSWTMSAEEGGVSYDVLFFCSASVAANRLVGPPQYDGIVADYRHTFELTRDWQADVFLANHTVFFDMAGRRARQEAGDDLAFVDPEAFPALIGRMEAAFEAALVAQGAPAE